MIKEEEIQEVLDRDKKILTDGLLNALPKSPRAIFLVGGYGRGEGAWIEVENGLPKPYNDYDLAVITEYPMGKAETNILRKRLAKEVGIHWIDIDYYSNKQLQNLRNTIHDIDLLYASKCIYGDCEVLKKYGPLDPTQIGFPDILKLYRTRMWTLLGSWEGPFQQLKKDDALFFRNQMAKATLAACDMLLVKAHKYHTSYRQRVEIICNDYRANTILCKQALWAIQEKLRPRDIEMTRYEMEELYHTVKELFIWSASETFGRKWKYYINPHLTANYEKTKWKYLLYRLYLKMIRHQTYSSKSMDIFVAQNYVLLAERGGKINEEYVKEASHLLQKWGYIAETNYNWNELHYIVANARNNI